MDDLRSPPMCRSYNCYEPAVYLEPGDRHEAKFCFDHKVDTHVICQKAYEQGVLWARAEAEKAEAEEEKKRRRALRASRLRAKRRRHAGPQARTRSCDVNPVAQC